VRGVVRAGHRGRRKVPAVRDPHMEGDGATAVVEDGRAGTGRPG
jgi:hypothetical protein